MDLIKKIKRLYNKGLSILNISYELNRNKNTIKKYVKEIENLMNDKDYYNNKSKKAFKETTKIRLNVYMTLMKKIYDD